MKNNFRQIAGMCSSILVIAFMLVVPQITMASVNHYQSLNNVTDNKLAKGDVNGDGIVSAADVTLLIDIIINAVPDPYGNGDVNNDTEISISDVNELVDMIINGAGSTAFDVDTNVDISYEGGGTGPARVAKKKTK